MGVAGRCIKGQNHAPRGSEADHSKHARLHTLTPEILIFGTGRTVLPAPREVRDYISSLGIQLDVMDSVSGSHVLLELPQH